MSKEGNILTNYTAWIGVSDLEKKGTLVNGSNQVRTKTVATAVVYNFQYIKNVIFLEAPSTDKN